MSNIKKMVITALFIAIGVVLPIAFHAVPFAGRVFLPMHIPILMSGLVCGIPYGIAAGLITPLLSNLFTGMPPTAFLPSMTAELVAYGAVSALLIRYIPIKELFARVYFSLIGAMLAGRLFFGVLNALIFSFGEYSMQAWVTAAFITSLPGIVIQIIIIPIVVVALQKANLVDINGG